MVLLKAHSKHRKGSWTELPTPWWMHLNLMDLPLGSQCLCVLMDNPRMQSGEEVACLKTLDDQPRHLRITYGCQLWHSVRRHKIRHEDASASGRKQFEHPMQMTSSNSLQQRDSERCCVASEFRDRVNDLADDAGRNHDAG